MNKTSTENSTASEAAAGSGASAASVRLEKVGHEFENTGEILRDISFSIAPGDFTALLGPSGSGKSTLLRLMADLLEPARGRVSLGMENGAKPKIGFVFQEAHLLPWCTASQNVALPLELAGVDTVTALLKAKGYLAQVGLKGAEGLLPHQLSGGMKMRVSLARALVNRPDVLLLDEPFAALDEVTRQALQEDLLGLWQELRPTVLFVTHSSSEAVFLAQRIFLFSTKPARLIQDLRNDFDEPRNDALRSQPSYVARVSKLRNDLRRGPDGPSGSASQRVLV